MTDISIVVPVYSGSSYLEQLITRIDVLKQTLDSSTLDIKMLECICVNDNSEDGSYELLIRLKTKHPWLQVICLSKNFGQHPATVAGITHTAGDWVATLDEDLQHDPGRIPQMLLQAVLNSSDIVYAQPSRDGTHSAIRNFASSTAKALISGLSGISAAPLFNSFRLIRGPVARAAAAGCSKDTYYDVALSWYSDRVSVEPIKMIDERTANGFQSGYTLSRLVSHATRLAVSSDVRLMHFGSKLGFMGASAGFIALIVLVASKYLFPDWASEARGWASIIAVLLLINGLIMFQVGLVLRFLTSVLQRSQGRPCFFSIDRNNEGKLEKELTNNLKSIQTKLNLK